MAEFNQYEDMLESMMQNFNECVQICNIDEEVDRPIETLI